MQEEPLKTSDISKVAQPNAPGTSGTPAEGIKKYEARSVLHFSGRPIDTVKVEGDLIMGTVLRQSRDERDWVDSPHFALANLPTYDGRGKMEMKPKGGLKLDQKSVEKFVREYGLLHERDLPEDARVTDGIFKIPTAPALELGFQVQLSEFLSAQELLRLAWSGEPETLLDEETKENPIALVEQAIRKGFQVEMRHGGKLSISTDDLWKFICLLFLLDEADGKLGMCQNPDCPAPYFRKKRRTQKFCEAGPCSAYAARQYTQRWWDTKGSKQRQRKRAKGQKRRKKQ